MSGIGLIEKVAFDKVLKEARKFSIIITGETVAGRGKAKALKG